MGGTVEEILSKQLAAQQTMTLLQISGTMDVQQAHALTP